MALKSFLDATWRQARRRSGGVQKVCIEALTLEAFLHGLRGERGGGLG